MPQSPDPLVSLVRLRAELKRLRETHGYTQQQVAAEMEWSPSKMIRIEGGRNRISTNDLRALLTYYNVQQDEQAALIALGRDVRKTAWWDRFSDIVTRDTGVFLGYESVASQLRNFQITVVPGLLQTEEYAAEAMRSASTPVELIRRGVELRMERQKLFERAEPPETHFIMDEAVIRRVVGGRSVMKNQLLRLKAMAARPEVKLQIVPFSVGLYPRHRRGYSLFEFPDDSKVVLVVEGADGDQIMSEPGDAKTEEYVETFEALEAAIGDVDAIKLIDDAMERLS